jgi:hypothetical protein
MRKLDHTYIAGPMTGKKNHNYPAFFRAEKRLNEYGIKTINPARLNAAGEDWHLCLRNDLKHIVNQCNQIALLDDWHESKGARLELAVAIRLGMSIISAKTLKPLNITLDKLFTHRRKNGETKKYQG